MLHSEIKIIFKWQHPLGVTGRVKLWLPSTSSLWVAEWCWCLFSLAESLGFIINSPLSAALKIKSIGEVNLSFPHFSTNTKSTFLAPESQGGSISVCHMNDLIKADTTFFFFFFFCFWYLLNFIYFFYTAGSY